MAPETSASPPSLPVAFMGVFALTFVLFLPALSAGWVSWDDPGNFLDHTAWRGLGGAELSWMWTQAHMGHYTPLTWMTLAVDHAVWGMDPRGYHLTNVVLHALSAGVFFLVLERVLRRASNDLRLLTGAAAIAALLYGIHPLRVESVAWITERRDVLSMLLFQGCLYAWVRYVEAEDRRWFVAALALHALSLSAKAHAMTLPVVLLVLDFWPFRRQGWVKLVAEKVPFAGLAALFAGLAIWAQSEGGALVSGDTISWGQRLEMAIYGAAFYPAKVLWPADLSPLYEWDGAELHTGRNLVVLLGVTALGAALWKKTPAPLVAWVLYLVILSPVSGIAQSGPQLAADRYSYFSCLPFAALAGLGLLQVRRRSALLAGIPLLIFLGQATWTQTKVWTDSFTLWGTALRLDPDNEILMSQLAEAYIRSGNNLAAIPLLEDALEAGPPRPPTLMLYAGALGNLQRFPLAIEVWSSIPPDAPEYAEAQEFIGIARQRMAQ